MNRGNFLTRWILPHVVASYAGFLLGFVVQWVVEGNGVLHDGVILLRVCAAPLLAPVLMPFAIVVAVADWPPTWSSLAINVSDWAGYLPMFLYSRRLIARWYERGYVRQYPPSHCGRCGYDLRASKGRCPECGTIIGLD